VDNNEDASLALFIEAYLLPTICPTSLPRLAGKPTPTPQPSPKKHAPIASSDNIMNIAARSHFFLLLLHSLSPVDGLVAPIHCKCHLLSKSTYLRSSSEDSVDADRLLAKAKAIRESLPPDATNNKATPKITSSIKSEFALPTEKFIPGCTYRLNVDIGREEGTWMDPRWGASGRRIEFTLDISFPLPSNLGGEGEVSLASQDVAAGLLKSVTTKSNSVSSVYAVNYAPFARLKGGFDKMTIHNGGYCIETSSSSRSSTLRFCFTADGTGNASYGDVSIPEGNLYFALPYFGMQRSVSPKDGKYMALSTKEGTVTVKQMGWHTGWRREESRILGVFRAVSLDA
jgi:hypothetical protein